MCKNRQDISLTKICNFKYSQKQTIKYPYLLLITWMKTGAYATQLWLSQCQLQAVLFTLLCSTQVQLEVDVTFIQDTLKGEDTTEIRVKLIKKLEDAVPAGED